MSPAAGPSLTQHLILAVGARNRLLPAPGAEDVLYLRSLDEAVTLKQRIAEAHHGVVVIGGGFIGLEVAAAARMAGKPVTLIEAAPRLMARAVSPVLSNFFLDLHRSQGTEVLLNTVAVEVRPDAVTLENGRRIAADLVVAGIGVLPNVELARAAGLEVNDGIMVDEYMRTTDPAIFAIGDCAEHPNVFAGGRARLESVQNAVDQAKCVVRVITGQPAPYRDVPWFWTDQFEIRFQMAGLSGAHDQSVTARQHRGAQIFGVLLQAGTPAGGGFREPPRRPRHRAQNAGGGDAAYARTGRRRDCRPEAARRRGLIFVGARSPPRFMLAWQYETRRRVGCICFERGSC